jgi:hypothetical protein
MVTSLVAIQSRRASPTGADAPPVSLAMPTATALLGIFAGVVLSMMGLELEGGGVAVIGFMPLCVRLDHRLIPGFFFGPCTGVGSFTVLGYGVGPLGQKHIVGHVSFDEQAFVLLQWGGVLFLVAFLVVYYLVFRFVSGLPMPGDVRRQSRPPETWSDWSTYGVLLATITAVMLSYGFVTGTLRRIGGVDTDIWTASTLGVFSIAYRVPFFFLALAAARRGRRWWLVWAAALIAYSVFNFLDGSRGHAAYASLISALGFYLGGVRGRSLVAIGFVGAVLFVPISEAVLQYRSFRTYQVESSDMVERSQSLMRAADDLLVEQQQGGRKGYEGFLVAMTADLMEQIILKTPEQVPFAGFDGIERLAYIWIPVALQPNRPELMDALETLREYRLISATATGCYVTTVAEGYRRFGWIGIPVLAALVAALFAASTAIAWRRRQSCAWMAFLVFVIILSPSGWSLPLLSVFYFAGYFLPKYLAFFFALTWLQRIPGSLSTKNPRPRTTTVQPANAQSPLIY